MDEVLDELTDNADLKAVLAYGFGDYGLYTENRPAMTGLFNGVP